MHCRYKIHVQVHKYITTSTDDKVWNMLIINSHRCNIAAKSGVGRITQFMPYYSFSYFFTVKQLQNVHIMVA